MGEVPTTLTVMVPGAGLSPDRKEHCEKGFHISTESRQLFLKSEIMVKIMVSKESRSETCPDPTLGSPE